MSSKKKNSTNHEKIIRHQGREFSFMEFENHKKAVTRRDFFSRLLGATAGFAVTPSLFDIVNTKVYAQEVQCPEVNLLGSEHMPCIIIDYAGGIHSLEDVMALDREGGELAPNDYRQFGVLNYNQAGGYTRDDRFGVPMFGQPANHTRRTQAEHEALVQARNDANLNNVNENTNPANDISKTRAGGFVEGFTFEDDWETRVNMNQVDSVFIAGSSNSDNNGNMLAAGPGIAMTGVQGALGNIFGTEQRSGGGRHESPFAAPTPPQVRNQEDIRRLAQLGNLGSLNQDQAKALLQRLQKLSEGQLAKFSKLAPQEQVDVAIKCGMLRAKDLVDAFDPDELVDPTEQLLIDAFSSSNAGIMGNSGIPGPDSRVAGLVQLAVNGYAKCVVIQFGGHDRHRGNNDNRPYEAQYLQGELTRGILEYAQKKGKPCMVVHTTDGAMSTDPNTTHLRPNGQVNGIHPGDNDTRCGQLVFFTSPKIDRSTNSHWESAHLVNGQPKSRMLGGFQSGGLDSGASFFARTPAEQARMQVWLYSQVNGITDANASSVIGDLRNFESYKLFKKLI